MNNLFIGKTVEGVTVYRSRETGSIYHIAPFDGCGCGHCRTAYNRGPLFKLYRDGELYVKKPLARAGAIKMMELADLF